MSIENKILTEALSQEWEQFTNFLGYMPNPDTFLEDIGETIEIYNKMLIDDEIGSSLETRKRALLSYDFDIIPADKSNEAMRIRDFVLSALKSFPVEELVEKMLSALEFGYSVIEIIWHNPKDTAGQWFIKDSLLLKPERFGFKKDGTLMYIESSPREINSKYKFVVCRHGISPENPYGLSVLRRCYWPWFFKKAGFRFWMITCEKFGVPTVLALFKTDASMSEEEIQKRASIIAEMLQSIKTDAGVSLANIDDVKVLETKGEGMKAFDTLINLCNRAINKTITGQILATGDAKYGSKAQASVHQQILKEIILSDAKKIASILNTTIIKWIVELNFGADVKSPLFSFNISDETPWQRITDAIDRGIPISRENLYKEYGLPKPRSGEDVFINPKAGSKSQIFSEEGNDFFVPTPRQRKFLSIW